MDDAFAGGFFLFFILGSLVVAFVLCWLVGKFAENRGRSFAFGFLIAFLLSPLIGFIIVYIVTSDYHSDSLITGRMSSEDFIRAEHIRLQLRRTELRWKMFSNLVYLSLFVGGAYFLYRHPGPLRPYLDRLLAGPDAPPASSAGEIAGSCG